MRGQNKRVQLLHTKHLKLNRMFSALKAVLLRRYTIIVVPHTEKRTVNFQINLVFVLICGVLFIGMGLAFLYSSSKYTGTAHLVQESTEELSVAEANLDLVLDELALFLRSSEIFQETLNDLIKTVSAEEIAESPSADFSKGDLSLIQNLQKVSNSEPSEVQLLRNISLSLQKSVAPLEQIDSILASQEQLLTAIPNYWPLLHGLGRVTMEFGPNIHPVTGQWYLHKGFDIAGVPGTPVVASADGKIIEVGFDPGYGLHVWVRHQYGFRTHYSHLGRISVSEGQEVQRGEFLGTLGNTGISTGPHLDFQILIGTEVVDPSAFLKISNTFLRWTGNR